MTDSDERIARLVRESFAAVGTVGVPERDLWIDVARRLETPVPVPHLDWALCAVLVLFAVVFPGLVPYLLYHL